MTITDPHPTGIPVAEPALGPLVRKAVVRRTFGTLATASGDGRPHAAGVLYAIAGGDLWISTTRTSRKARNILENPRVAVNVAVRRVPFGPPSSVALQGDAVVVALNDPEVRRLVAAGGLKAVTSHGELELPDGCFLRVRLRRRVPTYGLGMSLVQLVRDPLAAGRVADVEWVEGGGGPRS